MTEALPVVYLTRHGETAWTVSGRHTWLTDLPLTSRGEQNARQLGQRLKEMQFARVFTSALQRAMRTCELAGFGAAAEVDSDLVEWNYGQYEGLRSAEILAGRPDWQLFHDGCPGGESPADIGDRARSRGAASPLCQCGCPDLLQRPLYSSSHGALAWSQSRFCRKILSAEYCKPERYWIRAQSLASSDPALEQQPSCNRPEQFRISRTEPQARK